MAYFRADDSVGISIPGFPSGGGGGVPNNTFAEAPEVPRDAFSRGNIPNVPIAGAPTVTILGQVGTLSLFGNDIDVYKFTVTSGDIGRATFTFDIDTGGSGLNSELRLFNSSGALIGENDNGPTLDPGSTAATDSYLTFTPTVAGTYYIVVTSFDNDWSGTGPGSGGTTIGAYSLHVAHQRSGGGSTSVGTVNNDVLTGNTLAGEENDVFNGYAGDDSINGGIGNDVITGGDGADDLIGGFGNDVIFGDLAGEGVDEGPGDEDEIDGGAGDDDLSGGQGNDSLLGGTGNDLLSGGVGNDRIEGGAGGDRYAGKPAGQAGVDTFVIGATDSVLGAHDTFLLKPGSGNPFNPQTYVPPQFSFAGAGVAGGDVLSFTGLPGVIFWHDFHIAYDIVAGSPLAGGGNGLLEGFAVYLPTATTPVTWLVLDLDDSGTVSAGDPTVLFDFAFTLTSSLSLIELNILAADFAAGSALGRTLGTGGDDSYLGDGAVNFYTGGEGSDLARGGGDVDLIHGDAGDDQLFGDAADDRLEGGAGNDVLQGGAGRDRLIGGDGVDAADFSDKTAAVSLTLHGAGETVVRVAGLIEDTLLGIEDVVGGTGADMLVGDGAANRLDGGQGADTLDGGAGNDTLIGGEGNDAFRAAAGADQFDGGAGVDVVNFGPSTGANIFLDGSGTNGRAALGDTFTGVENLIGSDTGGDWLVGDGAANRLTGGGGNDVLWGRGGIDQLEGGDGADRLWGGAGNDILVGGAGNDVFVFGDSAAGGGFDRTTDFTDGQDRIEIDASMFGGGLVAGGAVQIRSGATPTSAGAVGGVFLYDTDNGFLSWDADGGGAGAAVLFFRLQTVPALSSGDFLVVA